MNIRTVLLVAVAVLIAGAPAGAPAAAGIEVFIKRTELENILVTGAPYRLPVDLFVGTQTLTFQRPRDLTLENGRIRFRVTCTGSPVPFRAELEPEIGVVRDPDSGDFEIFTSRLPVRIPGVGSIDLKDYIPPHQVPALIEQVIGPEDRIRRSLIRMHDIRIEPRGITVEFDFRFLPEADPGAPESRSD